MIHAVEMAFERINVSGPESTKRRQPGVDFFEWFRLQPVETALCVDRGFDETGLAQHAQVFRHRRLRHRQLIFDVPDRLFGRDEETQDRAAARLGNDVEDGFHSLDIPHRAYACQCIYTNRNANRRRCLKKPSIEQAKNDLLEYLKSQ